MSMVAPSPLQLDKDKISEARQMIKEMRDGGVTHTDLARAMGMNISVVRGWFTEGRDPGKKSYRRLKEQYDDWRAGKLI